MNSSEFSLSPDSGKNKSRFFTFLIAGSLGIVLSAVTLPWILPGVVQSIAGADIKAFWFLSRSMAIISYLLIWLSVVWGLFMTTKISRIWPGHVTTADLHKYVSILGLSLAALHGFLLLGDKYMNMSLAQLFVPFAVRAYRPVWVGLGQIALYLLALIIVSFYIRKFLGQKLWRATHFLSFLTFFAVLIHGLAAGSDTITPGMFFVYYLTGTVVVFLTFYRIFNALFIKKSGAAPENRSVPG